MEKKRMMEHGAVQEEISLRIEYDIHKCEDSLRTEGKITKEVSLGWNNILCGRGMSIGDILDFQEKANALLQKVKALLADGTYVKVSVTKAAYENVPPFEVIDQFGPHMCTLNQFQFECWNFADNTFDCDPEEEGAGLYLQPDTRYTDATWDMILYWNKDILKSLTEANL